MQRDPYKYFRVEARELVDQLGKGTLDLEKGAAAPEVVARLLRLAHTLKGAARVVKQREIADHAHGIEELLAPLRDGGMAERATTDATLRRLDSIAEHVAALSPAPRDDTPRATEREPEAPLPAVRIGPDEMEGVLDGIVETQVQLGLLRRDLATAEQVRRLSEVLLAELEAARARRSGEAGPVGARAVVEELHGLATGLALGLGRGLDLVDRELGEVREGAERLKLLPASVLFTALERTARDTAQSLGTTVAFETRGGDTRLDAGVLAVVQHALVQTVRNAVAHGIEPESTRRALAKPPNGTVSIEVRRRSGRVAFVCRDDGGGIDLIAVRRAAARRGLGEHAVDGLGTQELLQLLLRGGLSTSGTVTEVAGRGIGLDVVREAARQLGGEVSAHTEAGRGTTIELLVPLTVSALDVLLVAVGERTLSIPLDAVQKALRVENEEIARSGQTASIVVDGEVVPFAPLARLLAFDGSTHPSAWSVVVMRDGGSRAAVGVDRLLGTQTVLLRPTPRLALAAPVVAGASLDPEGNPQLVLDPEQVIARVREDVAPEASAAAARLPILIVDDSLTTRMLEQSILESAGYDVELAASAEEALEKARARRYALFLVDVEMPGMDGFTFIEQTRADAMLRDVPAMLVTSRASPEDRRRGETVGARGYVVKTEFDQTRLLERIRELVG